MKKFAIALSLASFLTVAPAFAQANSNPSGAGPAGMTCITAAIPASSTAVVLTQASAYITIVNLSSSTTLYFSPVSPATTSNFAVAPNSSYSYSGMQLSTVYLIGSVASGNYSLIAH